MRTNDHVRLRLLPTRLLMITLIEFLFYFLLTLIELRLVRVLIDDMSAQSGLYLGLDFSTQQVGPCVAKHCLNTAFNAHEVFA